MRACPPRAAAGCGRSSSAAGSAIPRVKAPPRAPQVTTPTAPSPRLVLPSTKVRRLVLPPVAGPTEARFVQMGASYIGSEGGWSARTKSRKEQWQQGTIARHAGAKVPDRFVIGSERSSPAHSDVEDDSGGGSSSATAVPGMQAPTHVVGDVPSTAPPPLPPLVVAAQTPKVLPAAAPKPASAI